jgi:trehalose 6-phosphate synthase/phosphatase
VNPYHVDAVAEALHEALAMDPGERLVRMRSLQRRERENDVHALMESFLRQVVSPPTRFRPLARTDFAAWLERVPAGKRLALFLDLDRELPRIGPAQPVAEATLDALRACAARRDTEVTLVSGRPLAELRGRCGVPGLGWIARHGLEIEVPGLEPFRHPDLAHFTLRLRALAASLAELRGRGARVEEKGASVTLDARAADPRARRRIVERARELVIGAGFQAREASGVVEARPPSGWDKGRAVFHVLRARHGPAWPEQVGVIYVGDDETDEDAFRALAGLGATFRVGSADGATSAARRLPDWGTVEVLLRWVAERPGAQT